MARLSLGMLLALLVAFVAALALGVSAHAGFVCEATWNGGDGNWGDSSKWTPNAVPDGDDNVCITGGTGGTVTVEADHSAATIQLGGGTNAMRLKLPHTVLDVNSGTVAISSNGTLELATGAGSSISTLRAQTVLNSGEIETNPGGLDQHELDVDTLNNNGTLDVNQDTVILGGTTTNSGTVDVADGRLLSFPTAGSTFNQAGTITLGTNSAFTVGAGFGGAVNYNHNSGNVTGTVIFDAPVNINLSGTGTGAYLAQGEGSTLTGDVAANKTLTIQTDGGIEASVTASGTRSNSGTIVLTRTGGSNLASEFSAGTGSFTNNAGGVIQTSVGGNLDHLLSGSGSFVNAGTLDFDSDVTASIDISSTQTGTVSFDANGDLGNLSSAGTFTVATGKSVEANLFTQTGGTAQLQGNASLGQGAATVDLQGGVFKGTGTVTADVTNGGEVQPGASAGTLTIDGDYTQTAGGTLRSEVRGPTPGATYDRLAVGGTATLGGALVVDGAGFTPSDGQTFAILTATGRSGQFASEQGLTSPGGGRAYAVNYKSDGVELFVAPRTINVAPAGGAGGGGGGASDKTAPAAALAGRKTQKLDSAVEVIVSCKSKTEDCLATGSGTLSVPGGSKVFRLKGVKNRKIARGKRRTLKLRVPKKALRAAKRARRRHKKLRVKVRVVVKDGAGNSRRLKRTIRLR